MAYSQQDLGNKKCIESLIKAGTFTEFPETRATLLASFETIIDTIQSYNKKGIVRFPLNELFLLSIFN